MLQEINPCYIGLGSVLRLYMGIFDRNTLFRHPYVCPNEVYNCPVIEGRRRSRGDAKPNAVEAGESGLGHSPRIYRGFVVTNDR